MPSRSMTAIAALDRQPTEQEAKALAVDLLNTERPGSPDVSLSWFISDELPPLESTGLLLHDYDQLSACSRDAPEGCYLVVMLETSTKEK